MPNIDNYPRLTDADQLPGQRVWSDIVEQVHQLGGQWVIVEEGMDRNRASSVRKALTGFVDSETRTRRYPDIQHKQRTLSGGITAFVRSTR